MSKKHLLIYCEQLATAIELLCQNTNTSSNTLFQIRKKVQAACMQISAKPITGRVKRICFQNLKSPSKNVAKQRGGYNCHITQKVSIKQPTKTTEIFAAVLDEY